MGLSASPLSRYSRWRPWSRTSTAPTSRSTRRCLDTCGCAIRSTRTRSFTGRSPPASTSRICRRRGSATALNASSVVAARAMAESYTHIGICQAKLNTFHQRELRTGHLLAPGQAKQASPARQAAKLVLTGVPELDARSFEQRDRSVRDEDLAGPCEGSDPSRSVHCHAAEGAPLTFDFAGMDPGADLEAIVLGGAGDRSGAANGTGRPVEHRNEAVAGRVDLEPAEPVELEADAVAVTSEERLPPRVAEADGDGRGVDDVRHEQGRHDALTHLWHLAPPAHADEVDRDAGFIPDDARVVARLDVERVTGTQDAHDAVVRLDLHQSRNQDALVMKEATRCACDGFHVLRPAPPRLVGGPAHVDFAEDHDLLARQRQGHDLVRFVEALRDHARHAFNLLAREASLGHVRPLRP